MALAMESRGFNAGVKRSSFYELKFSGLDAVFLVTAFAVGAVMIFA